MVRLTSAKALRDLSYIAHQRARGQMTVQLEEIEAHHKAFLASKNVCRACGRELGPNTKGRDGYGPECADKAEAQAAAVA